MNDNTVIIVQVITALIPAVVSIIALFQIKKIHVILNSRLTELLRITRAEGIQEGKDMKR